MSAARSTGGMAPCKGGVAHPTPGNNETRLKTIFNPSRMHLSSMETPTVHPLRGGIAPAGAASPLRGVNALFGAAFWGEDHTAMTALSNKGHSTCWSNQEFPILPMQRA